MALGFCNVDVLPLPKVHDHDVGSPVERSVKCTVYGAHPAVSLVKKSACTFASHAFSEHLKTNKIKKKNRILFTAIMINCSTESIASRLR